MKNYLSDPIVFNVKELDEIDGVIDPLRLNILLGLLLNEVLSVSDNVSNIGIVFSQWNCSSVCQNNVFEGVSGDFSTKEEVKAVEE